MRNLVNELKRRNVFRATAAYSVVAWVIGQAAGLVLPTFEAPEWVLKALIVLLVLGFPMTVILAWVYELTPQGLRRTEDDAVESDQQTGGARAIDSIIILALVVAVLIMTVIRIDWHPVVRSVVTGSPAAATVREPARIAVLPVVSVSTDQESQRLADGLAQYMRDELRAQGIAVIGRHSAAYIRESGLAATSLGAHFDLDWVLQGSLRRNDGQLFVDMQLIDTATGNEHWTTSLQAVDGWLVSRVNDTFVDLLGAMDVPTEGLAQITMDTDDFSRWLEALAGSHRHSPEELRTARLGVSRLLERQPQFGPAHALLAIMTFDNSRLTGSPDYPTAVNEARAMLKKAASHAPNSLHVQRWRLSLSSRLDAPTGRSDDFERLNREFHAAQEQYAADIVLPELHARHLYRWGDYTAAIEQARRVLKFDPANRDNALVLIRALLDAGKVDEAFAELERMTEFLGNDLEVKLASEIAMRRGDLESASEGFRKQQGDPDAIDALTRIALSSGNNTAAMEWLESWPGTDPEFARKKVWEAAIGRDMPAAYELALETLRSASPEDDSLLGRLALQAGKPEAAVNHFENHFSSWPMDKGPLLGKIAWMNAPWFAAALRDTGRVAEARRILDRHLAGVIARERGLSPAQRDLYLAANFAVAERPDAAIKALDRAISNGFRLTWGALGTPVPLQEVILLDGLHGRPEFAALLKRMQVAQVG